MSEQQRKQWRDALAEVARRQRASRTRRRPGGLAAASGVGRIRITPGRGQVMDGDGGEADGDGEAT